MTSSIRSISNLTDELSLACAAKAPGETYHKKYQKDRTKFRLLIKQELKLERAIRRFQKEMKDRLPALVDWQAFKEGRIKLMGLEEWSVERKRLEEILMKEIEPALSLGIQYGEDQFRVPSKVNASDPAFQAELRRRSGTVAQGVIQTIKERLRAKLKTIKKRKELKAQEFPFDFDPEFQTELEDVADDPAKANQISRTEIIGGLMAALLLYGMASGAGKKTWRTVPGAEVICRELSGKTAPIDESFDSLVGPVDRPPDPHPNCRCYLDLST